MASYHTSFTYNGLNSATDKNLIVAAFEPDDGLKDTFLSMDIISDDYYDGTKKYNYGSKYNTTATITITVIKNDGSDFSLSEVRSLLRWLTGSRIDSWLDCYVGDRFQYAFLGRVTDVQQMKMDARTIGLTITFSSVSPWAYSAVQTFDYNIVQVLYVDDKGILNKKIDELRMLEVDDSGVLYNDSTYQNNYFDLTASGTAYIDNSIVIQTDNQTDDLYTYINLDIKFTNGNSDYVSIKNLTLDEETLIVGMSSNEVISLSAKQFIVSDIPNKIFGDDFNFVWPRLAPGVNEFLVDAPAEGKIEFSYRYPMKVGDCAMDVDVSGSGINCGDYPDNGGGSFDGTIAWRNITDTPTTIEGYGITDAYTMTQVDNKIENIEVSGGGSVDIDEDELNNMLSDVLGQ